VRNPHSESGNWQWNEHHPWNPAPLYWGGGFWGGWAIAALAAVVFYGEIVDAQTGYVYPSYLIEPDSPGAQLLANYGLQQTSCGPPDLVVIWGPMNSVICTYPNDMVGPGNYGFDPATLTLYALNP
jgi:hypothetical protein